MKKVRIAWKDYIENGELDSLNIVPEYVSSSWRRCRNAALDPYAPLVDDLTLADLKRRLSDLHDLVSVAEKVMENIFFSINDSGLLLVLSDAHGCLLSVIGSNELIAKSKSAHLHVGSDWSELKRGTNAIGTCLIEKKPVQIHAAQHFCKPNHILTCSAAPICNSTGNLIAVLDISNAAQHANVQTLGLAVAAATAIENQIHLTNYTNRNIKQHGRMLSGKLRYNFDHILGDSAGITLARNRAKIAAKSASTVLICGESGTGKEMFAQSIHALSDRCDKPFVSLNCAAIPETLIESELFGYEYGAFTGASKGGNLGKIESSSGGTLFLDEIGDMPLLAQVKLLRVIQERRISRLGSSTEVPVDIRLIAATHKNLKQEMINGNFRKDLFYRINVLGIDIPPLRERANDIPQIVESLVSKLSLQFKKPDLCITEAFMDACCSYSWPGNVREVENAMERAINMIGEGKSLTPELMELDESQNDEIGDSLRVIPTVQEMECKLIFRALKYYTGNIVQASNCLGMSRTTLYRKIREYKINT